MDETRDAYRRFHARRHRILLELLAAHMAEKVERCLDIGGGGDVGDLGATILDRFAEELHGLDLEGDVELGRRKGVLAKACDVDTESLPYEDAFFDAVLFASVIEHLYNPRHALTEIARVTKSGGLLVVEAPSALALGRRLDALAGRNPFQWFNRYNAIEGKVRMEHCSVFYTPEEVEALLAPDFEVVERRFGMHNPPVNPMKKLLREAAFRLNQRLADCFFVVARRR